MGNVACGGAGSSATTSDGREEASAAADKIQRDLLEKRRRSAEEHKGKGEEVGEDAMRLPRSTQDDQGRFLLVKEHFPGARDAVGLRDVWRWRRNVVKTPRCTEEDLKHLPLLQLDKKRLESPEKDCLQATWIGHASVLVQFDGWNILSDPVFSRRCSPVQFAGPARLVQSPIQQASDLPTSIDAILISHNHYDHLDRNSVIALAKLRPAPVWFVPLGVKSWMETACGISRNNVVEMDWSEEVTLPASSSQKEVKPKRDLKVHCLPCQHQSNRGPTDRNKTLWCSWICSTTSTEIASLGERTGGATYYFGGDTAYCPLFKKIGALHGPIDFAAIPIGAYGHSSERWFMKPVHMDPYEAVQTHMDLRSKQSLGIHWGTFQLTAEPILEPPQLLKKALKAVGVNPGHFVVFKHGETRSFPLRG